jgi:hypothetical protein
MKWWMWIIVWVIAILYIIDTWITMKGHQDD